MLPVDVPPGEDPERFPVLVRRLLHHVLGKLRAGGGLVPGKGEQVVADELLVEAFLRTARSIPLRRPEAGRVGGQRLSYNFV